MSLKSDRHPCVTLALIASMPRVFEAVQDKCITKANCKKDSKQFYVGYIVREITLVFKTCVFNFRLSILSRVFNVQRHKKMEWPAR